MLSPVALRRSQWCLGDGAVVVHMPTRAAVGSSTACMLPACAAPRCGRLGPERRSGGRVRVKLSPMGRRLVGWDGCSGRWWSGASRGARVGHDAGCGVRVLDGCRCTQWDSGQPPGRELVDVLASRRRRWSVQGGWARTPPASRDMGRGDDAAGRSVCLSWAARRRRC